MPQSGHIGTGGHEHFFSNKLRVQTGTHATKTPAVIKLSKDIQIMHAFVENASNGLFLKQKVTIQSIYKDNKLKF